MAFSSVSNMWNKWNIRGIIILSLSLQVFLILFAPLRKKVANSYIVSLLWLAYLMADWVAALGIGLVSHSQSNSFAHAAEVDIALQAFWASFLLLHLGGPDTITAFSLEDSSLWRRHLLSLICQVSVAIYVFVQIFPNDKSLVIPTMLVFLAGVIKNTERIIALYLSSLPRLREALSIVDFHGMDLVKTLEEELEDLDCEYSSEEEAKLVESTAVKHGYYFFAIFGLFLLDLFYSHRERLVSCKYFHKVSAMDALRVISIELHFMYEALHTKVLALRSKLSYIFRFIAFTGVMMAFVLFNRFKKHELRKLDVEITYILLFGGIALDVITLFTLVFSDWTVVEVMRHKTRPSKLYSFLHKLISATYDWRKPQYARCTVEPNSNATYKVLDTPFIFRRWSESISACTIFSELWNESPRKMYRHDQCRGIIAFADICSLPFRKAENILISCFNKTREIVIGTKVAWYLKFPRYMSKNPFINKLWIFIVEEVKRKSGETHSPTEVRKIFEARGDMFLRSELKGIDCNSLLEHVTMSTFDSSVIMWHVATEIWYNIEKSTERKDKMEFSKILSDYLLYLLIKQPQVVSAVAGFAKITFALTWADIKESMSGAENVEMPGKLLYEDLSIEDLALSSTLSQGTLLARKLERFGEKKWEVMSGVWVEMLSYAAGHIKGEAHALVLSKGGELLAFVWLLMAHFGCLYKPEWGAYEGFVFENTPIHRQLHDDNGNQEEDDSSASISI